jgi:hypothetical protein
MRTTAVLYKLAALQQDPHCTGQYILPMPVHACYPV